MCGFGVCGVIVFSCMGYRFWFCVRVESREWRVESLDKTRGNKQIEREG